MGAFAFEPPQASPRVAQRLSGAFQEVGNALQLIGAALLLRRQLLRRHLLDEQALLRCQVDALADIRQQHSLAAGQAAEAVLEAVRFARRLLRGNIRQQAADGIADAALVVDQTVDAAFQRRAFVELIRQRENAPRHQLQVDAGVVVVRRRQAHGVVEPRRALPQRVDRLGRGRVLGDAVGERKAKVESGAVA